MNDFGTNHKGNVSIITGILKKEHNNPYGCSMIISGLRRL